MRSARILEAAKDQFSAMKDARTAGEARGEWIGRIRLLLEMLGEDEATALKTMEVKELQAMANDLEKKLRNR